MEKYTGISIGPILKTLAMARKPRELWSASYIFSHLMKCIYREAKQTNAEIISPAEPEQENIEVGIYPDRIFLKGTLDVKTLINETMKSFYSDLLWKGANPGLNYFNLMTATCNAEHDSAAIATLNQKLDVMELWEFAAADSNTDQTIYNIISKKSDNPLHKLATGDKKFEIKELKDIARFELSTCKGKKERSHHRYYCVVQADGDNMGKAISHEKLQDGGVLKISEALVKFGIDATRIIKEFGGLPIYAGGDDLLFIAPVIGKDGNNIFDLVEKIETEAFNQVAEVVNPLKLKDKDENEIQASLSFGISISYHKHPLYESLEAARTQLFGIAKQHTKKNAVAWTLQKHSGGTFSACFSRKANKLNEQFKALLSKSTDSNTVSAVAHKIRQFEKIVRIVLESGDKERLDAMFEKILEFSSEKESYFGAVKALMPTLYEEKEKEKEKEKDNYVQTLYSLLRTAKFINGEDLRDE